ncbi:VOC family protein [Wenxinia saemankumensis]|uniref:VOC domain-containing protein n=1 Tax=Wenxinia saemankumensis TaxID=1447782 RepID=A0A1M6GS15_9RHOB|nr:VOC family protein [Wenxinia saemankumensis]SHJ12718.1 hypothetical protein SAMN05444417_2889 [Wenxinia saemankumensis]
MTERLAALSILVPDYDEAIAFFCGTLGFALVEDIDQGTKRWVRVRPSGGGADLILARATGDQASGIGAQGAGRVWLFLETSDLARMRTRMEAAGVPFEEPTRSEPYGRVAVFRDPWGNRWDLLERAK